MGTARVPVLKTCVDSLHGENLHAFCLPLVRCRPIKHRDAG